MDCEIPIIHHVDLIWALLATVAAAYPLYRLREYWERQSARDLCGLILTFVAYPWAMAVLHLVPFDKGLVWACCLFSMVFYIVSMLRFAGIGDDTVSRLRPLLFSTAGLLALAAFTNPWHGGFATFEQPVVGKPNHMLGHQQSGAGLVITMCFVVLGVAGTALITLVQMIRSRVVLSQLLTGVLLPLFSIATALTSLSPAVLVDLQINGYFLATTTTLLLLSLLMARSELMEAMPATSNKLMGLMPDAIVIVTNKGLVVNCNPAFELLVDKTEQSMREQPLADYLPNTEFVHDNSISRQVSTFPTANGTSYYDVRITPFGTVGGQAGNKLLLLRDVTEQTLAFQGLESSQEHLHRANAELARLSNTDPLTGLYNRRYFQVRIEEEMERFARDRCSFGLLSIDLDHFKAINDGYGHEAGDEVLCQVARSMESQCRAIDCLARVGGEEFVVLVVACDATQLATTAERFRAAIAAHPFSLPNNTCLPITVSIGATLVRSEDSLRGLLDRADQRLYNAKRQGRNQSVVAG